MALLMLDFAGGTLLFSYLAIVSNSVLTFFGAQL